MIRGDNLVGRYRHYKGGIYDVLGEAKHSETLEMMVVYKGVDGPGEFWVRPRRIFREMVEHEGELQPRFNKLS
jgi:hypothetical protein